MGWKDGFYEALRQMLEERYSCDAVRVVDFEEYTETDGACSTCFYEETVVDITYENSSGGVNTFRCYDSFADLVRTLTD